MRAMILRADHLTEEEIAAQDARQALEDEARVRSEEARRQEGAPEERVSIGAPKSEEPAEAETPEPKAGQDEGAPKAEAAEQTS
jgi:hypothetical protein